MSAPSAELAMSADVTLAVDWKRLGDGLIELLVHGFATLIAGPAGVPGAAVGLLKAVSAVEEETTAGGAAWQLTWISFAWALNDLRSDNLVNESEIKLHIARLLREISKENETYYVSSSFFDRPSNSKLYVRLRDELCTVRHIFRNSKSESEADFKSLLDSHFNKAIFDVYTKKPQVFSLINLAVNNPASKINSFEKQWESYRLSIQQEFCARPVFGQDDKTISLSKLYTPLRGFWQRADSTHASNPKERHITYAEEYIEKWINDDHHSDLYMLVGGGPGSGKSTTLKSLASNLSKFPSLRPLFIPLQHIAMDGNLQDAIGDYFTKTTNSSFTSSPLDRSNIEGGPKIVLIFDGLDELACPGQGAIEVTQRFITQVSSLRNRIAGAENHPVKIIISGRMPSFQEARKSAAVSERAALEVVGYAPQIGSFATNPDLAAEDHRPEWWARYSAVTGGQAAPPGALSDPRLRDISNEPLLSYLLAISDLAVGEWEKAAQNRNYIYSKLIELIWYRGWGSSSGASGRQGPGRRLTSPDFNLLMETIALAAWLGGDTRVASEAAFSKALISMQAQEAWDTFSHDGGADMANLAMNFYLKAADQISRGFEFTHKSFGDYLAARAIIKIAKRVSTFVDISSAESGASEWLSSTAGGVPTNEIHHFIRDELKLVVETQISEVERVFTGLEKVLLFASRSGLPAHKLPISNWHLATSSCCRSETALLSALNGCAHALDSAGRRRTINLEVGGRSAFASTIERLLPHTDISTPLEDCFSFFKVRNTSVYSVNLSGFSFYNCEFDNVELSFCNLIDTTFIECEINDLRISCAISAGLAFIESNISGNLIFNSTPLYGNEFDSCAVSRATADVDSMLSWRFEDYELPEFLTINHFDEIEKFDSSLNQIKLISRHLEAASNT